MSFLAKSAQHVSPSKEAAVEPATTLHLCCWKGPAVHLLEPRRRTELLLRRAAYQKRLHANAMHVQRAQGSYHVAQEGFILCLCTPCCSLIFLLSNLSLHDFPVVCSAARMYLISTLAAAGPAAARLLGPSSALKAVDQMRPCSQAAGKVRANTRQNINKHRSGLVGLNHVEGGSTDHRP